MKLPEEIELIGLWERGEGQIPLTRAMLLLAFALPEKSSAELARLSLGARDDLILQFREHLYGNSLAAYAECNSCTTGLELLLNTGDLRVKKPPEDAGFVCECNDYFIRFRLPNSEDLSRLTGPGELKKSARSILKQCVEEISKLGEPISFEKLPDNVLARLEMDMKDADPQSEILLQSECPGCGASIVSFLDIGEFLFNEIRHEVKQLLQDVHYLARYYGWSEKEILAMTSYRRNFYMELAN